jgi:hypothetical protein
MMDKRRNQRKRQKTREIRKEEEDSRWSPETAEFKYRP